jgi:hypothetical protein
MNLISVLWLTMALTLTLSHRMGEGMAIARHRLAGGCPASAVAGFSVRRRMVLPLLGGEGRGEVEP